MGFGLTWEWKSKVPHRPHLFHISGKLHRSDSGGATASPIFSSRSTYSETMPVTVISLPLIMSSSTSTIPPAARPPSAAYRSRRVTLAPDRAAATAALTPAGSAAHDDDVAASDTGRPQILGGDLEVGEFHISPFIHRRRCRCYDGQRGRARH